MSIRDSIVGLRVRRILLLTVVTSESLGLLHLVHDEQVPGEGVVRGVAQAAFTALVGRDVGLVLGNVLVETHNVLGGEATHGTFVCFEDIDL